MGIIKNNWGFIVISLICFCLMGYLVIRCGAVRKEFDKYRSGYEQKLNYLDNVGKKRLKLNGDNVKLARKNADVTTQKINSVHREMMDRFKLKYQYPDGNIQAVQDLMQSLKNMLKQLEESGVYVDSKAEYLSFDAIAKSSQPPVKDDIGPIFRQLAIIRQIVNVVSSVKLAALESLERPLRISVHEESEYTVTPVEITVVATPEKGQEFINTLCSQSNHMFVLRTIEMSAPDVTTDVAKSLEGSGTRLGSGRDIEGENAGRRGGRRTIERSAPGRNMERNDNLVEIPMRRQELLAFEPKEVTFKLRFDFIEPKYEQPSEEGQAEQE